MTPHGTQSSSPTDTETIPHPRGKCKLFFPPPLFTHELSFNFNNINAYACSGVARAAMFPYRNTFQSFNIASVPTRFRHRPNTSVGGRSASRPSPDGPRRASMPSVAAGMASMV